MGRFWHPPGPKNRRERGKIVNPFFKVFSPNLVYPRATVCLCEGRGGVGTVSPVRGLGLLVLGYECGGYAARVLRLLLTRRFIRFPGLCFWETAMKAYGRIARASLPLGDAARSRSRAWPSAHGTLPHWIGRLLPEDFGNVEATDRSVSAGVASGTI